MSGIRVIDRLVVRLGGQAATARLIGCRQSEVWRWVQNDRIPSSRIPSLIERAASLDPPIHLEMADFFTVQEPVNGRAA